MHALLAVVGSRGDVQPLMALAQALRAAGHQATIAAPPRFADRVRSSGLTFVAAGGDLEAMMRTFGSREALGHFREAIRDQRRLLDVACQSDVVVGAPLVPSFATLADAAGVPFVAALYSPQWLPSRHHGPPVFLSPQPRWLSRVHWRVLRASWNLLFRGVLNAERAALGLAAVGDAWGQLIGEHQLVAADPALAPLPPDAPASAFQSGAWILQEPRALDQELSAFCAAGPAPIYVGFGSMAERAPRGTDELVVDALQAAGAHGVVAGGAPEAFPGLQTSTVRTVGSVPHAALFPRCALVVHHGGAGTTATAARAGVPQLLVPHGADQFQWAQWARLAGVAPEPLPRRGLTAARLATAIEGCLADDALRRRAGELRAQLRDDGAAQAARHLESVVGETSTARRT